MTEKRDLSKDLDRFCELWEMDSAAGDIAEFAGKVLPHAIDRALEAERKLNEQHSYEDRIRSKYNLSLDFGFEDLVKEIHRLREKYERGGQKCNRGHVNKLPVSLWDCPMCTEELRSELEQAKTVLAYIATHNSYGNDSEGFAFCQNEAEAALSRLGVSE